MTRVSCYRRSRDSKVMPRRFENHAPITALHTNILICQGISLQHYFMGTMLSVAIYFVPPVRASIFVCFQPLFTNVENAGNVDIGNIPPRYY